MKIKVYLADDHTVVRDGLRALLDAHPEITVIGDASNGRQAVNQVKTLHPDVVVMDISMPELNGIDATEQILQANSQTQVIILSMFGTSEHIFRALQAGARGYLLKESAGREVVEAVKAVHSGHLYLSEPITKAVVLDYLHLRKKAPDQSPLAGLSQREREIFQLVVEGKSSTEIGSCLNLSPKTVESYRSRLMRKLGISDLPSLIKFGIQQGLIPLE
jgi:DNA-binding NarL/FixJ family response regulator